MRLSLLKKKELPPPPPKPSRFPLHLSHRGVAAADTTHSRRKGNGAHRGLVRRCRRFPEIMGVAVACPSWPLRRHKTRVVNPRQQRVERFSTMVSSAPEAATPTIPSSLLDLWENWVFPCILPCSEIYWTFSALIPFATSSRQRMCSREQRER